MSCTKWMMCFMLLWAGGGDSNPVGEDVDGMAGPPPEGPWSGVWNGYHVAASSDNAMVLSMGGDLATAAGMEMLRLGGNAADAVLAASTTNIVHLAGLAVSFGGVIAMVYYDAQSRQGRSMNAGFRVPLLETNPLTIPTSASGRSAMVPGFFAGVQAAHYNFGRLQYDQVFQPAIELAEDGFPMPAWLANVIQDNWHILSRQPEAVAVFTKPDGTRFSANEQFTQPLLAETLRRVASAGAQYIYEGEWAQKFVRITQREGGRIQLNDLEGYRANLAPATHTMFNGHDIYSIGLPAPGGVGIVEAFNLIELSDLDSSIPGVHRVGQGWLARVFRFQLRFRLSSQTSSLSGPSITRKASHIRLRIAGQVLSRHTYSVGVKFLSRLEPNRRMSGIQLLCWRSPTKNPLPAWW